MICKSVITQSKGRRLIVNYSISHTPWMLFWWPGLKFARFAREDWFPPDMFPKINYKQINTSKDNQKVKEKEKMERKEIDYTIDVRDMCTWQTS